MSVALVYGGLALVCGLDAFFPIVPSETSVIAAGVRAADGGLSLWLSLLAAAAGVFVGDNVSYLLGRNFGPPVAAKLFRTEKGRHRLARAAALLQERGATLIVVARFVPGGRTATTFAAGTLGMPWRRFAGAGLVAAVVWASFATSLGYFGGLVFSENIWLAMAFALGLAAILTALAEVARRVRARQSMSPPASVDAGDPDAPDERSLEDACSAR